MPKGSSSESFQSTPPQKNLHHLIKHPLGEAVKGSCFRASVEGSPIYVVRVDYTSVGILSVAMQRSKQPAVVAVTILREVEEVVP